MFAKSFIGFKKIVVPYKESKWREPREVLNYLFLVVFACAYIYFPHSGAVSEKCNDRELVKRTAKIKFSTPSQPIVKRMRHRNKLSSCRRIDDQKNRRYRDEPLVQLVNSLTTSRLKTNQSFKKPELEVLKRGWHFNRKQTLEEKLRKQRKQGIEDRLISNPNANHGPAALRMLLNPNKQAASIDDKFINPNSLMIDEKLAETIAETIYVDNEEEKGVVPMAPLNEGLRTVTQQRQSALKAEVVQSLEHKSLLFKTSILDSEERISELCDSNQKLEIEVREKDALLLEKDDLIMGIQMQLMNYESVLESTPNGDFVQENSPLIALRNDHKKLVEQLNKEQMEKQLQQEKRIASLLAALKLKERAMFLQTTGSEGPCETKECYKASIDFNEGPGKLASPDPTLYDTALSSRQQMQIESLRSSRTSRLDVEMYDENIDFVADPDNLLKSTTELELLRKRNVELESQVYESNKTIGELNVEMRDLECFNRQLSSQLEQEPGRSMTENTNSRSSQAQPGKREMWRKKAKPRKMFSVSKFLSCRKVETDERLNGCEVMADNNRVLISQI